MCGISGFNWQDEGKIKEMVSCLDYRGPDANGIFSEDGVSLGHNRLSIIDLSKEANSPMVDNDNEVVIIFNGEIYNFLELKEELKGEYDFKTNGDTEVILAGYRKWGKGVADKLNGMFAFAIWDRRDHSLFCARDHAGMKPLYYFWDPSTSSGQVKFVFASEIPAILKHGMSRKLNKEAFNHYFRVLYTPEPMTMFENIYKLPASYMLVLKDGHLSIESYGKKSYEKIDIPYPEAVSLLRDKVLKSVERHLVADVPVGVYLSGGIDSSTVLFSMSKYRANIKTFTVGFELRNGEEKNKFNHDFELARETAKLLGSDHHSIVVSVKDALDSFEEVAIHNSDPVSNPTAIAMLLLARFARNEVTVSLTGNAGDELFGGYDRYRMALAAYYYKKLPRVLRSVGNEHPRIAKLNYDNEIDLFAKFMFEKDSKLSRVIDQSIFESADNTKKYFQERYMSSCVGDPAECLMQVDQMSWLPEHFFMLSDKMSMANALEERMPLADKELVAFSRTIKRSYKLDLFRTKKILKDAFKDDLPDFLFSQPKRGWFSPAAKWMRDPRFSQLAKEILSGDYYAPTKSLFNWLEVQKMLEKHINKEEYNLTIIWAIMTFQTWARRFEIEV